MTACPGLLFSLCLYPLCYEKVHNAGFLMKRFVSTVLEAYTCTLSIIAQWRCRRGTGQLLLGHILAKKWSRHPGAVVPSTGFYRNLPSVLRPHLLCKINTPPFWGWCPCGLPLTDAALLDQKPSCRPISLWEPTTSTPQQCVWVRIALVVDGALWVSQWLWEVAKLM